MFSQHYSELIATLQRPYSDFASGLVCTYAMFINYMEGFTLQKQLKQFRKNGTFPEQAPKQVRTRTLANS